MSELKIAAGLAVWAAVEFSDLVLDLLRDQGAMSQEQRDRAIVQLADVYLKSKTGGARRPTEYLRKYLKGDGKAERISLFQMLVEDAGVNASARRQIMTYLAQEKLFADTGLDLSPSGRLNTRQQLGVRAGQDNLYAQYAKLMTRPLFVNITQDDYKLPEWWGALGSIQLNWQLMGLTDGKRGAFVRLWGVNTYRWHPSVGRVSQKVHQALERLKTFGAKEFDMIFEPALLHLQSGEVLTGAGQKPRGASGSW